MTRLMNDIWFMLIMLSIASTVFFLIYAVAVIGAAG